MYEGELAGQTIAVALRWDTPKDKPKARLCCMSRPGTTQLMQINVLNFREVENPELQVPLDELEKRAC
eukprot:8647465-Pyramimonas_sp.AAC.1